VSRVADWLKVRAPIDLDKLRDLTNEPIAGHLKKWWFALGGTAAYLFFVQIATGILLLFVYVPEPGRAYDSVQRLTHEVSYGWWLRSIHKWAASGMIVAVCLHLLRVYFTGAYRKPRELTWAVGCLLLFVTLAAGLTGYSLVYEQLSYWGATVTSNLMGAVPGVGDALARLVRGGEEVGPATLTRFFVLHAAILPAVIMALVAVHIVLVRVHGMADFRFRDANSKPRTFPFVPDHLLTEMSVALVLMVLLNVLALSFPAGLGERADPLRTPEHIRPEWYFYFAFRWLKLTSLRAGVLGTFAAALILVFWPAVDAGLRRISPRRDLSILFGAAAVLVIVAFTVWEALS
jgi:quinol-cytochrome oxidoreductase complex cytochrome b subunit